MVNEVSGLSLFIVIYSPVAQRQSDGLLIRGLLARIQPGEPFLKFYQRVVYLEARMIVAH